MTSLRGSRGQQRRDEEAWLAGRLGDECHACERCAVAGAEERGDADRREQLGVGRR